MKSLRNLLLASASSVALVGTAAAADMPIKAAPAPIVWNWAGPYIGLNLGAAWNHAEFSDLGNPVNGNLVAFFGRPQPFWSPTSAGFTVGGLAGYNWQTGNFVYGVEGDLNWVDGKNDATIVSPTTFLIATSTKLDWMASVRGRLGVTFSQVLLYGTGGVAFAHFTDSWGAAVSGLTFFSDNEVRIGWIAGGGLEYMIAPHWTVRVEGLYADYGTKDVAVVNAAGLSGTYSSSFRHTVTTARAALNWKW